MTDITKAKAATLVARLRDTPHGVRLSREAADLIEAQAARIEHLETAAASMSETIALSDKLNAELEGALRAIVEINDDADNMPDGDKGLSDAARLASAALKGEGE